MEGKGLMLAFLLGFSAFFLALLCTKDCFLPSLESEIWLMIFHFLRWHAVCLWKARHNLLFMTLQAISSVAKLGHTWAHALLGVVPNQH